MDLHRARTVATRELGAFVDRLQGAPPEAWQAPTRLKGWKVTDLAAHVAWGSNEMADSFVRMAAGDATRPAVPFPALDPIPEVLAPALERGAARLVESYAALTEQALEIPFQNSIATYPGAAGPRISVMEFGTHRADLEQALGGSGDLSPDVVEGVMNMSGVLLIVLSTAAKDKPAAPTSVRIGSSNPFTLAFAEGSWRLDSGPAECEIAGDDNALALFILGRIGAGDPALKVVGDSAIATNFKAYFPGP